jgi:phage-related protein
MADTNKNLNFNVRAHDDLASSYARMAAETEALARTVNNANASMTAAQLRAVAAQESMNKVLNNNKSTLGDVARAQATFISAQQKASDETKRFTEQTEKSGDAAEHSRGKYKLWLDTIALLGPTMVATAAPLLVATTAVAAGLSGVGAAGVLAFLGIRDQMQQNTKLGQDYVKSFTPIKLEFQTLERIAAEQAFPGIRSAMKRTSELFPTLDTDVATLAGNLGGIADNLARALVPAVKAANPFLLSMGGYLQTISARFADWATGGGPQRFADFVREQLPKVRDTLKSVGDALLNIGKAAGALGVNVLPAISKLADVIAAIPVPVLTAMIATLEVSRLLSIAVGLQKIAAGIVAITVAMLSNPIGAVAVAVALLATGVYLLWTRWDQVWKAIENHPAYAIVAGLLLAFVVPGGPIVLLTFGIIALAKNWNSAFATMKQVAADLVVFVGTLPERIVSAVGSGLSLLAGWGADVVRGIISGIGSMLDELRKQVESFIPEWIRKALGIHSPPAWAIDAGQWIARGLIHGMMTFPHLLENLAAEATAKLAEVAKSIGRGFIPGNAGNPISSDIIAEHSYAASLFPSLGWSVADQLQPLIDLWNGESGWNPQALNPSSGAFGIPQSLPADKMASAGTDWQTNPATQIRWGLGYIHDVYGSPSAAYGAWLSRSPHWYQSGAWEIARDELAMLHKGEMVVPEPAASQVRQGGTTVVRLDEWSIRRVAASLCVELDGDKISKAVTARQNAYNVRGGRR